MKKRGLKGSIAASFDLNGWQGGSRPSWWRGMLGLGAASEQRQGGGVETLITPAGVTMNSATPLSNSTVWRCRALISETIASLPLRIYERTASGRKDVTDELRIGRILSKRPNKDQIAMQFWDCIAGQAVMQGNGFGQKIRSNGELAGVELLSADRLTWRLLADGTYEFRFTKLDGTQVIIPERDIFHVPGVSMWGKFGMSVIRYGALVFGSAQAANEAASATFKNGLQQNNFFKIDRVLRQDQRDEFRQGIKRIAGALNAGEYPLLEGGMDVGAFGLKPADAQLLQSRQFSKEEICTWFGVPAVMVGAGDKASSWASSSESLNLWFLQYTLTPWLKRIEGAIWKDLFTPAEQVRYYAEFNVEGLLRANTAGRSTLYASALQNGWLSRNDVRRLENLPPVDGGDLYTAQSNLVPLEDLGKATGASAEANTLQDALKSFLGLTIGATSTGANGHDAAHQTH
jgi:HK97 family phage portal protein